MERYKAVFLNLFGARTPKNFAKWFCSPAAIEQTPTKLPVNIQSSNEIEHNVACYRCIFINHSIVYNKTNSVGTNKKIFITSQ